MTGDRRVTPQPATPPEPGAIRSVLTGRRLLSAVVVALLGPAAFMVYGYNNPPPEPPPDTQPAQTATLPQIPGTTARAQLDRSTAAQRLARTLTVPTLITPARLGSPPEAGQLSSLALAPRARPYTLDELQQLVPSAFGPAEPGKPLLVESHIEVPAGATLTIDSQTPNVVLASSPTGFATIMSRGELDVIGRQEAPVSISSVDAGGNPDTEVTDGRAFVLQSGGRMDTAHARFDSLGFGTGTTSGVAWVGTGKDAAIEDSATNRVTGTVEASTFTRNQFGIYTHEAEGMRFTGNTFANNIEYGFDPHDFSNNFVVEDNTATANGKHGFIFSRGCQGNVLRNNRSFGNVGHGFMIDDGRTQATVFAEARINNSDNNAVIDNIAYDNGNNGVEIEGGTGNVVAGNILDRNYIGVRVKNNAVATVNDNTITDSRRYGIDVQDPDNQIPVNNNTIDGSWGGISLTAATSATLGDNTLIDVNAPMVVNEVPDRQLTWLDSVVNFVRWNPMLLIWSVVLLFPLSMWVLRRLVPTRFRKPRRAVHA